MFKFVKIVGSLLFFCLSQAGTCYEEKKNFWEITEYLWNLGIAVTSCDVGPGDDPFIYFQTIGDHYSYQRDFGDKIPGSHLDSLYKVQPGDIVWLRSCFVPQFYKEILADLGAPIVLVINDGDDSFPSTFAREFDVEDLLDHKNIIHVFVQNCDYKGVSKKITHLPIGIDFHTLAYKGKEIYCGELPQSPLEQEKSLKKLLAKLEPTYLRKPKAFVDFQLCNSMRFADHGEDRATIFKILLSSNLIDYPPNRMKRSKLWETKGQYAFSISPHGWGLDCHRTWEDLVLGCIVIVKTSPLDPMYEGLPVVIVKDWKEVNEKNMLKWLDQYKDAFTNPDYRKKLTNAYWIEKIRAVRESHKKNC